MQAEACVCREISPSAKEAWANYGVVFLGTVEMADPNYEPGKTIFFEQSVRVRVDEPFKGVKAGQRINLHQGKSDCMPKFRTGERWVFYFDGIGTGGPLGIRACRHMLGRPEPLGEDLLFLRRLPRIDSGTKRRPVVELAPEAGGRVNHRPGAASRASLDSEHTGTLGLAGL